jgi:hypothetical protein
MALLSFADSTPRAYRLKAGNACPPISTLIGTSSEQSEGHRMTAKISFITSLRYREAA